MDENTIKELTQALFSIAGNLDRLTTLVNDLNNHIGGITYALDNQTTSIASPLREIGDEIHSLKDEVHDLVENGKDMRADIAEIRAGVDEMR